MEGLEGGLKPIRKGAPKRQTKNPMQTAKCKRKNKNDAIKEMDKTMAKGRELNVELDKKIVSNVIKMT